MQQDLSANTAATVMDLHFLNSHITWLKKQLIEGEKGLALARANNLATKVNNLESFKWVNLIVLQQAEEEYKKGEALIRRNNLLREYANHKNKEFESFTGSLSKNKFSPNTFPEAGGKYFYRTRPVEIEAEQWNEPATWPEAYPCYDKRTAFINAVLFIEKGVACVHTGIVGEKDRLRINDGDYIIAEKDRVHFKRMSPDIFNSMYERIPEETTSSPATE